MFSDILTILVLVALGFTAFFIFKKMRTNKKSKTLSAADHASQDAYNKSKTSHKEEEITLTIKEKIALSWQFLTNITEQVLSRFSKTDQKKVQQAGKKLAQNGAHYQHNVEQESTITLNIIKTRVIQQNKDKTKSKSR